MSADLVISGYVRIAKQDLDGARLLNRAANRNAAYLCEQAAEKLIRAVLTSEGIQGGVRHELPDMVAKIADENPVKPLLRAIEHLDAYATAYRYPSPRGRVKTAPTPAELDQDIVKIDNALSGRCRKRRVRLRGDWQRSRRGGLPSRGRIRPLAAIPARMQRDRHRPRRRNRPGTTNTCGGVAKF